MCLGRVEDRKNECLPSLREACVCKEDHNQSSQLSPPFLCELCDSEASVYCQADDAFLCQNCDARVHAANFLALRHIRCFLCTDCHALTHRYLIGASVQVILPTIVCTKGGDRNGPDDISNVVESDHRNQLIRPFLFL
ncbi:hypothetical protein DCAR_0625135 [Daucus carota subsp. sativus]|uniref:Uncharacterized protein n=1 Tax=Daucus carota subsp. sativus TaxID=79200 RepID=A0A164W8T0_DAUCS|nr:hypothetical protein DCAR_0625135 [Daucus carota subsp. sativus]